MKTRIILLMLALSAMSFGQVKTSGSITASGATCAATTACVTLGPFVNAPATAAITISGTYSATAQFEASADNAVTWVSINAVPMPSGTPITNTTATGTWTLNISGMTNVRVRASAYTSGTAAIVIQTSDSGVPNGATTTVGPSANPCYSAIPTTVAISQTASTKVISAASGKRNIICGIGLVAGVAEITNIVEGTGSTCGTATAAIAGSTTAANGMSFAANGGISNAAPIPGIGTNVDTCLTQSGSSRVAGWLTYVQVTP